MRRRAAGSLMGAASLLAVALAPAPPARAQEVAVGWEQAADDGLIYAGIVIPHPLDDRLTLLGRIEASRIDYRFPQGAVRARVASPGLFAGLGLRVEGERWSAEVTPGLELRRTTEWDADGTSGAGTDGGVSGEAALAFEPADGARLEATAFRSQALDYTWVRAGLARRLGATGDSTAVALEWGPEAALETAPEERALQLGARFGFEFPFGAGTFELRAGLARVHFEDGSHAARPYVGLGATREF